MKRCVKHIEGTHLTAADRRNILDCFAYLLAQPGVNGEVDWDRWSGRRGSPKRYRLTPDGQVENRYRVEIEANERDDWGREQVRRGRHLVDLLGVGSPAQPELF